jgi:hypothetical protein
MISQYNVAGMPAGPRNIMLAVGKSIRLEGFIVSNHFNLLPEFQKDMSRWIREGKLTWKETVLGIAAPDRNGTASPRKRVSHAEPNPAVAARDDRNAPGQIKVVHGRPSHFPKP